jgi:DNA-binding HxlR family transcriptional regulator
MRGVPLSSLHCSIARTLDVVGERWTLLILRDAFNGVRRFDQFAERLPVARNVLTDRLQTLVEHGILRRERYQERPDRYEYRLTEKGQELYPVLIGLLQWGDRHLAGADGPPLDLVHKECDSPIAAAVFCSGCGERLGPRDARGTHRAPTQAAG